MSVHVFLGPSLPVADARRILDAEYHGPISAGDVVRLMPRAPRVIAIVDGIFERVPAVWHKEILFALSQGVAVLGASSMGALRAAELHPFGMVGVGRIFEAYRDGTLEDDDEVAVAHASADEGYRPLSDPMVNIREGLRRAVEGGILPAASEAALVQHAKATFYPERSWASLVRRAPELAAIPRAPDLKRADALALIEHVRDVVGPSPEPVRPTFEFHATQYWHRLVDVEAPVGSTHAGRVTSADLARHVRLVHPERDALHREAALMLLLLSEASRTGVELDAGSTPPSPETLARLADRLLGDVCASARLDRYLAAALARREELAPVAQRVAQKHDALRRLGADVPSLAAANVGLDELSAWYEARFGAVTEPAEEHARRLGFRSWEEFLAEVILELVAERAPDT